MASRYLTEQGLEWLADRNKRNWRNPKGAVCLSQIAKDAGIARSHIYRCLNGSSGSGLKTIDALLDLAESTGASRARAEKEMFVRAPRPEVVAP